MCEYAIVRDLAHHFLSMTALEFYKFRVVHDTFVALDEPNDFVIVAFAGVSFGINDTVYWNDAVNHDYFQGGLGAVNGDYSMIYDSWENYADGYEVSDRNPGYDIIYYSPCDDFGNMDIFNRLRRVSKKGTILGVQGIPLFSGVSVGNFVNSAPLGLAPDSDTYDSSFTVGMYNALNSIGYFSIYYQYLDCSGGGGDANADMGGDYLGDGSVCNNGTWINERPRL